MIASISPTRPIVRYHGGKWRLAPWIISHFPAHRVYVEPFGGAASVLLRKPRSYAEIYNDLDGEIVNLFRVARDRGEELLRAIELTPFAREEFDLSYQPDDCPVEQARRTMVRCGMGFGSTAANSKHRTGFRGSATRSGSHPGGDWASLGDNLRTVANRLRGVIVENRDAMELMRYHDGPETLHYVDPPYLAATRTRLDGKGSYRHELSDDDHRELLCLINDLRGMVVISGYPHPLYDEALAGWHRVTKVALTDGRGRRTETLWISPNIPSQNLLPLTTNEH
ncbi:MAG TPA: DNA adenine methylase [Chthoniobacteraceae bacterium]|nr:DNA adenine methylase [Chthoniobacteraceae bacterium]